MQRSLSKNKWGQYQKRVSLWIEFCEKVEIYIVTRNQRDVEAWCGYLAGFHDKTRETTCKASTALMDHYRFNGKEFMGSESSKHVLKSLKRKYPTDFQP